MTDKTPWLETWMKTHGLDARETLTKLQTETIGYRPGTFPHDAPSTTYRAPLKQWCALIGLEKCHLHSWSTLKRVYNADNPVKYAAWLNDHSFIDDDGKLVVRNPKKGGTWHHGPNKGLPIERHNDQDNDQEPAPEPEPKGPEPMEEPTPKPVFTPAPQPGGSKEAELARLLREIAGSAVDEATVRRIAREEVMKSSATPISISVKGLDGVFHKSDAEHRHPVFERVLRAILAGCNVLLIGPAGSGKTYLAHQVARAAGLDFHFNGAVAGEHKLNGYQDAHGQYHSTPFHRAYTEGGLYCFDEVDGSWPNAVLPFNSALAGGHHDFPTGNTEPHESFRVIACANTFGNGATPEYVGRNSLDGAFLDRFVRVVMDYDTALERALVGPEYRDWADYVIRVRRGLAEAGIKRHIISPRATINGAKLLAAGWDREDVEASTLFYGLDKGQVEKVKAAAA